MKYSITKAVGAFFAGQSASRPAGNQLTGCFCTNNFQTHEPRLNQKSSTGHLLRRVRFCPPFEISSKSP